MNKNILYLGIAVIVGLLAGYLFFGNGSATTPKMSDSHDHSGESVDQMWTCSMHPQIMRPEAGDCPICGMDLIPTESGGEGLTANQIKMTKNAMALAGVETIIVGSGANDDSGRLKLSGKVAVNQESDAVQSAYFNGRIERLSVNFEGEDVKRGQQLATIYSPELVSAQQELITASNLKATQPTLYKAVRNKLKLWKLSENQINQIETSGRVKENFPVYANVSGVVSMISVEEGDYVKTGMPLMKIANLNTVWAIFDGYENQLSLFKKGQPIEVSSESYPNEIFKAKVSFVDPILNSATRTLEVRTKLNNKKGLLKPGMFVVGEIQTQQTDSKSKLSIPESAVLWTGERSLVYVKADPNEPVFEMREVSLGNLVSGNYIVTSGLENGEEIVAMGTFTVDAAAQLQGKKSMMNKEGGPTMTGHEGHGGMQKMEKSAEDSMELIMGMSFSTGVQKRFKSLLNSYLQLKDGLVASNSSDVQKYGKEALAESQKIGAMKMAEMEKSHFKTITEKLEDISKNGSLEDQRKHFITLSENMIAISQNVVGLESTLYVQNCPMANKNNGAKWLSLEKGIKNPYFGDAMLSCGSVIRTLGK